MNKSIIKLVFILVSIMGTLGAIAQQDAMFTQYFFNPLSVNSGYAGSRDALSATLLAREQWVGIDGRPRTQTFTVQSPLPNDRLAVGLSVIKDQVGPVDNTALYGDIAYRFQVTEKARLSLGIKAGLNFFSANLQSLDGLDPADVSFSQNIANRALPNFGFGAYYWADNYFIGLSAPKLVENDLGTASGDYSQPKEKRHLFLTGGYVFTLTASVKFKPTTLIRYVAGAPVSADITANFLFNDRLWVGGMYRFGDAMGALVSFQINNQLRAGYSYDYTLSDLNNYNNGSHELMISYDFIFQKDKTLSPRYF